MDTPSDFDLTLSYAATDREQFSIAAAVAAQRVNAPATQLDNPLVEKFAALAGQSIGKDFLLMNSGTDALRVVAETLRENYHPDAWAFIHPAPPYLEDIVRACGISTVAIEEHSLRYAKGLAEKLAANPEIRALVLIMPNNPTGTQLSAEEFMAVASICKERDITLVCDFAFRFFGHMNAWDQYAVLRESGARWVAIEETKKTFGLGHKGISVVSTSEGTANLRREAAKYAPVASFDKALVLESLEKTKSVADIVAVKNARLNRECLERHGFRSRTVKGMPFSIVELPEISDFMLQGVLEDHGIKMANYGTSSYQAVLRVSLSADPADFSDAMRHFSAQRPQILSLYKQRIAEYVRHARG